MRENLGLVDARDWASAMWSSWWLFEHKVCTIVDQIHRLMATAASQFHRQTNKLRTRDKNFGKNRKKF